MFPPVAANMVEFEDLFSSFEVIRYLVDDFSGKIRP